MPDYQNGKIYKIEPICEHEPHDIYIGSTTQQYLSKRFEQHKTMYNKWKDDNKNYISVFEIFDVYGVSNCAIFLVETFPCNSKDELHAKEGEYIKSLQCKNKVVAGRAHSMYYNDNREKILLHSKEYYQDNKEHLSELRKIRYENNKPKELEQRKQRYEDNKQKELEQHRIYYQKNKDIILEKITCECGCQISKWTKNRHEKSQKHINLMNKKETQN